MKTISRKTQKQNLLSNEDKQDIEDLFNPFSFENYCAPCIWYETEDCPKLGDVYLSSEACEKFWD